MAVQRRDTTNEQQEYNQHERDPHKPTTLAQKYTQAALAMPAWIGASPLTQSATPSEHVLDTDNELLSRQPISVGPSVGPDRLGTRVCLRPRR